jgi:cytochrome c553
MKAPLQRAAGASTLIAALTLLGCGPNMADQPRFDYLEPNPRFPDGMAARAPVEGAVARGSLAIDDSFRFGRDEDGVFLQELPLPLNRALLDRGRERFEIHCAVCHGSDGHGEGIVVRRGFPPPPTFHSRRLREAPIGYFTHVIGNGYGVMYPYASRVKPADRWAIAAYIRVLQWSQHADADALPPQDVARLGEGPP